MKSLLTYITITIIALCSLTAHSETLKVGILISDGKHRDLFNSVVKEFEDIYPNINYRLIMQTDYVYKASLKEWMMNGDGPDVLLWHGGERLFQYAREGKVYLLNDFWEKYRLEKKFSIGVKGTMSLDGDYLGVPISYYQWAIYYRKSIFNRLNLKPPKTWDEFIKVCHILKEEGLAPITIGNKYKWPAASWFDYLNLRINGLKFHKELLTGKHKFDDPKVIKVFEHWKLLIDNGFFVQAPSNRDWNQAMPFLYHDRAAMTLIGSFFTSSVPETLKNDFDFFRFPIIDPKMPVYEDAPTDLFFIPQYSKKKELALDFLLLFSSPTIQQRFNDIQEMISPHIDSQEDTDPFIISGKKLLDEADGHAQYFDRDTNAEMSNAALNIFDKFINNPDITKTVGDLEKARITFLTNTE